MYLEMLFFVIPCVYYYVVNFLYLLATTAAQVALHSGFIEIGGYFVDKLVNLFQKKGKECYI